MALGWRKEYLRYREFFMNIVALYKKRWDLRAFLEILLSLGTVSFFIVFALKPTVLTIAELYKEIQTKKETVAKLDEKIKNLTIAQQVWARDEAKISLSKTSVPSSPVPESYVRQIEGLAAQNGISLLGISVGEVTLVGETKETAAEETDLAPLPEDASAVTFSVSITGAYQQLFSFLAGLENLRRPLKIDAVSITSSENEEGIIKQILLVSGRVPFLK